MQVGVSEAIGTIIDAIDSAEFLDLTMRVMDRVVPSDLLCLLVHGPKGAPATLFENFQDHGWREGLQRYLALTYEIDPFYVACRRGSRPQVYRLGALADGIRHPRKTGIIASPDEEIGYRTVGWPPGMEEVGVSFPLRDGHTAQLSLYRFRAGQGVFTAGDIELLETLRAPVGAALRHHLLRFDPLAGRVGHRSRDKLTAREQQVADCLLSGRTAHATGRVLGISTETVKTYRKTIYSKLGIVSLLELHKLVQGQRLGAACG